MKEFSYDSKGAVNIRLFAHVQVPDRSKTEENQPVSTIQYGTLYIHHFQGELWSPEPYWWEPEELWNEIKYVVNKKCEKRLSMIKK